MNPTFIYRKVLTYFISLVNNMRQKSFFLDRKKECHTAWCTSMAYRFVCFLVGRVVIIENFVTPHFKSHNITWHGFFFRVRGSECVVFVHHKHYFTSKQGCYRCGNKSNGYSMRCDVTLTSCLCTTVKHIKLCVCVCVCVSKTFWAIPGRKKNQTCMHASTKKVGK